MKDFVDYQDLCYDLKKVFTKDFNKNIVRTEPMKNHTKLH